MARKEFRVRTAVFSRPGERKAHADVRVEEGQLWS